MARISDQQFRRPGKSKDASRPITSVDVTIALTPEEARLLPPSSHIKPNFPGVASVQSSVTQRGGELVLRYYMSERPFGGVPAEDIPEHTLAATHRWLTRLRSGGGSGGGN